MNLKIALEIVLFLLTASAVAFAIWGATHTLKVTIVGWHVSDYRRLRRLCWGTVYMIGGAWLANMALLGISWLTPTLLFKYHYLYFAAFDAIIVARITDFIIGVCRSEKYLSGLQSRCITKNFFSDEEVAQRRLERSRSRTDQVFLNPIHRIGEIPKGQQTEGPFSVPRNRLPFGPHQHN